MTEQERKANVVVVTMMNQFEFALQQIRFLLVILSQVKTLTTGGGAHTHHTALPILKSSTSINVKELED
jgi:hypothetical protein